MSESELTYKLQAGDPEAFRILYETYQKLVMTVCFKFCGNQEDAEDILQEVFIEVHKSIFSFRGDSKLSTWLYKISCTKSIDYIRSKKRKKRFGILTSLFSEENEEETIPGPQNNNPSASMEEKERLNILLKHINSLSENQRIAFTLAQIDGMSYKEISEIMNVTVSSVESFIFRARQNLKKKLSNFYENNL